MPTSPKPRKGDILVARPYLNEVFFHHAVILLLDADADGGMMGLSLNVPTDLTLHDIIPEWEGGKKVRLFCGGPCDTDRLFMLHTLGDIFDGSHEIFPGLFIGGSIDDIVEYIENGGAVDGRMRFFLGYSGWAPGQLAAELAEQTWALARHPAVDKMLTGSSTLYWRRELGRLGPDYRAWLMMPTEPELN